MFCRIFLIVLSLGLAAHAAPRAFDFKDPKGVNAVSFTLDSLLEPFAGQAAGVSGTALYDPGDPLSLSGTIVVDARSMTFPNSKMTEVLHSEKWMNVAEFPAVTFTIDATREPRRVGANSYDLDVRGTFTCHGVAKELDVVIRATYVENGNEGRMGKPGDLLVLRSTFTINRNDFGIRPGYAPDKVAEKIEVGVAICGIAAPEAAAAESEPPEPTPAPATQPAAPPAAPAPEAPAQPAPTDPAEPVEPPAEVDPEKGQLIVFLQHDDPNRASTVERTFRKRDLPGIRALAAEMGIAVTEVDASQRAPEDVRLTPLIAYQNFRGRSIYQGRFNDLARLKSFLRTARFLPQSDEPFVRRETPVMERGRTRVAAPLKITDLAGNVPDGFDPDAFRRSALAGIEHGFGAFQTRPEIALDKSDRSFYADFYPWQGEGQLYVSTRAFSQFHCHDPIFVGEAVHAGTPEEAFALAARQLEHAILGQLKDVEQGDGFDTVAAEVATASWGDLGLALPAAPERVSANVPTDLTIPTRWVVDETDADAPGMVLFRFPSPLDSYNGEAREVRGTLDLAAAEGAPGVIEVPVSSLTMGDEGLDQTIVGYMYLNAKKHPISSYAIDEITIAETGLLWATQTPAALGGRFTMRGKTQELGVRAELEPVIDDGGTPRLHLRASWQVNLHDFEVAEAEGPAPQNHTVLYTADIVFRPQP